MALVQQQLENLEKRALEAIKNAYGTPEGKDNVTEFVTYCQNEIHFAYWMKFLDTMRPEPQQVLDMLYFASHWSDGAADVLEFALPEDILDSVLSVQFDEDGNLVDIAIDG